MREIQSEHNIYEGLKVKSNEETNNWFSQGEGEVAAAGVQEPSPQVESVYLPTQHTLIPNRIVVENVEI